MSDDPFQAIRTYVQKHAGKERATFSIAGIKALLDAVDDLDRRLNEEQMQTANGGEIINGLKAELENRDQKTGRAAQASPEGVPCGGVSRQDQVAADSLSRIAAFLKERDENLTPDEADDAERLESAKCILEAVEAARG